MNGMQARWLCLLAQFAILLASPNPCYAKIAGEDGDVDDREKTACFSSVVPEDNEANFESALNFPPDATILAPETVRKIMSMSESLPVRPFIDSMMSNIPDLTTPDRVLSWLQYVEFRRDLDKQNTKQQLTDSLSASFGKLSFASRSQALSGLYDQVAGFLKAEAYPSEVTLTFEIPSIGLYLKDGKSIESADLWAEVIRFVLPLSKSQWSRVVDKEMSDGFHLYRWEMVSDGLPIGGCILEALTRFDSEFGLPYLQYIRIEQPQLLDTDIQPVILPKDIDDQELQYDCIKNLTSLRTVSPLLKVTTVNKGRDEFFCKEMSCEQVIRYNIGMVSPSKDLKLDGGGIDCRISALDGTVVDSVFNMDLHYEASPYIQVGAPYVNNDPPNLGTGTPSYGTRLVHLRYAEAVGASGSSCVMGNQFGWSDSQGHVTIPSSTTPVCMIPDARATNSAYNYPSLERFRNCTKPDWGDCDGSETEDALLPYSPPLQAYALLWSGSLWNRQNGSQFYHLNWAHDTLAPYVPSLQCKRSGNPRYVDYQAEAVWGGTTSGRGCAVTLGNSEYDSIVDTIDVPQATYHEYTHVLNMSNGTNQGSITDRAGAECRSPLGPDNNNLYTYEWLWRQEEGPSEAAEDLFTAFETISQNRLNLNTYPGDIYQTQMAGTYHYLAWLAGWENAARAMYKDTGLRHYNGNRCTGGLYLSGFAARDSRSYVTSTGVVNTQSCACYHADDPCACPGGVVPGHLSERENATKAISLSGPNWLHYEVDRTFNARTTETGTTWTDDVSNIWFAGPYIGRTNSSVGENTSLYFSDAPDRTGTYLSTSALPYGEWDYDGFSFFPGWDKTYYVKAHSLNGRNLRMEIINSDRAQDAYNDNCDSNTLDPCITHTFYDANTHYIRVWDDNGGNGTYTLEFKQVGDDHNDYEPEGTPLPLSQDSYMNGYLHANDVDYFRVFIPNNTTYSTASLPIRTCNSSGITLSITLYSSAVDNSGRFRNSATLATYSSNMACPSYDTNTYSPGGGSYLPQGWYFVKIQASSSGAQGYYRIKTGNTPTSGISSVSNPILVSSFWDTMYNDTTKNRIFRSSSFFSSGSSQDWYYLNLTGMEGRMVTVDIYGLDNGTGGTHANPRVELHSGVESNADNGYYNALNSVSSPIVSDKNGGLNDTTDPTYGNSHLAFTVVRGGAFRLKVVNEASSSINYPYQVFVDVKKQGTASPALPAWN